MLIHIALKSLSPVREPGLRGGLLGRPLLTPSEKGSCSKGVFKGGDTCM